MIFFDIDDTLTDSNRGHLVAIRTLLVELEVDSDPQRAMTEPWFHLMDDYLDRYFKNELTLDEQRCGRVIDFFRLYGIQISADRARDLYAQYHKIFLANCLLFDDVLLALSRLKGCPLGVISNGVTVDQHYKLANNGLASYFSPIVISDAIGIAKPNTDIFAKAASMVNRSVADCIYIGNSYELDYLGAKNAGMKSCWLNRQQIGGARANQGSPTLTAIVDEIVRS